MEYQQVPLKNVPKGVKAPENKQMGLPVAGKFQYQIPSAKKAKKNGKNSKAGK